MRDGFTGWIVLRSHGQKNARDSDSVNTRPHDQHVLLLVVVVELRLDDLNVDRYRLVTPHIILKQNNIHTI